MICERCGKRDASIHMTQVIGGKVKKLHLCEVCAEETGLNLKDPLSLADVLAKMNKVNAALAAAGNKKQPQDDASEKASDAVDCPVCHMRLSDFRKLGRLGCPNCYTAFYPELSYLIMAIQHTDQPPEAKPPEKKVDLASLQEELRQAIADERYEDAARLRDEIQGLAP